VVVCETSQQHWQQDGMPELHYGNLAGKGS